jgi:ketosteroid isomerase-like protein
MKKCFATFLLLCAAAAPALAAEDVQALAAQVREREIAFAQTMADRDLAAFRGMLAPDAIFFGETPLRGAPAIASRWQKFFEGTKAPFSWAPEIVEVQEGGQLALSSGPVFNPDGKRVGTFTSIWRREPSGEWRVIFDRGCPACNCETSGTAPAQ